MAFVSHVMLVMLVVSVIRWGGCHIRGAATATTAFRSSSSSDAASRSLFRRGGGGVAFGRRRRSPSRYPRIATAIADTVAATSLSRVMLVRTRRSSTPTMVSAAAVRRSRRSDTVVG